MFILVFTCLVKKKHYTEDLKISCLKKPVNYTDILI